MSGRILGGDEVTRRTDLWHEDADGGVIIEARQDVEPIIEANKADQERYNGSRGDKFAARIPLAIYEDLVKRGIAGDPKKFKAWLNDSDNRAFRVWQGRV
jgi:hypothetical protein